MTILRHPSLPEVEPKPLRFTFGCKFAEPFRRPISEAFSPPP